MGVAVFVCVYVCVCLSVLGGEDNWNYFGLPIFTFPIKRQRKDVTIVRSCNSVNSARLYNLEIIIKMSITVTIMLTVNSVCKKAMSISSRTHKFQERSTKKFKSQR